MSWIDFFYGGKKSSDVPFWVLNAKNEKQGIKKEICNYFFQHIPQYLPQ